jgi:hypothetical protein
MCRSDRPSGSTCSELAVLAMLGGLVLFGLAAQGLSLMKFLVSIGFGAAVLLLTWLWDITLRQEPRPQTAWRRAWGMAVFLGWLTTVAAVIWWYWG